jgi:hypothetical protein
MRKVDMKIFVFLPHKFMFDCVIVCRYCWMIVVLVLYHYLTRGTHQMANKKVKLLW